MLDKKDITFIKGFLIEYKMTRTQLAREAGIGVRTLYNALHTGKVSDITFNKILCAMLAEESQREMLKSEDYLDISSVSKAKTRHLQYIILVSVGICAILALSLFLI